MQAARGTALTGQPPEEGGQGRPRRVAVVVAVACFVFVADVISKVAVVATLSARAPVRLLGGLITLRVLRNSGAAFSIGTSMTIVFTLIAVGVIIFIVRNARRLVSLPWAIAAGMVLGGATGNLTDRVLRSPGAFTGHVVDWIQLPHWPVFNVADSSIVCGGALAVLLAARGIHFEGTRDGSPAPGGPIDGRPRDGGPHGQGPHGEGPYGERPSGEWPPGEGPYGERPSGEWLHGEGPRGGGPDMLRDDRRGLGRRGEDRPAEDSRA
jgi:signal peptidase II